MLLNKKTLLMPALEILVQMGMIKNDRALQRGGRYFLFLLQSQHDST